MMSQEALLYCAKIVTILLEDSIAMYCVLGWTKNSHEKILHL